MKEPPVYRGLYILKNAFQEEYYVADSRMTYGTYPSEDAARNGIDAMPEHVIKRAYRYEAETIAEAVAYEDMRRHYTGVVHLLARLSHHCGNDQEALILIEAACEDWIKLGALQSGWKVRRYAKRVDLEEPKQ